MGNNVKGENWHVALFQELSSSPATMDGSSQGCRLLRPFLGHVVEQVDEEEGEEAAQVGEGAVFVDVANPELHRLYARALAKTGRFVSAIFEYNSAIVAGAPPPMAREIYRELARGYDKLGQAADAERARAFERQVAARVEGKGEAR